MIQEYTKFEKNEYFCYNRTGEGEMKRKEEKK